MKRTTSTTPNVVTRIAIRYDPPTFLVEYLAVDGTTYHMKIKIGGLSSTSDPALVAKALIEQHSLLGTSTGVKFDQVSRLCCKLVERTMTKPEHYFTPAVTKRSSALDTEEAVVAQEYPDLVDQPPLPCIFLPQLTVKTCSNITNGVDCNPAKSDCTVKNSIAERHTNSIPECITTTQWSGNDTDDKIEVIATQDSQAVEVECENLRRDSTVPLPLQDSLSPFMETSDGAREKQSIDRTDQSNVLNYTSTSKLLVAISNSDDKRLDPPDLGVNLVDSKGKNPWNCDTHQEERKIELDASSATEYSDDDFHEEEQFSPHEEENHSKSCEYSNDDNAFEDESTLDHTGGTTFTRNERRFNESELISPNEVLPCSSGPQHLWHQNGPMSKDHSLSPPKGRIDDVNDFDTSAVDSQQQLTEYSIHTELEADDERI